jgi:hypothetical protein
MLADWTHGDQLSTRPINWPGLTRIEPSLTDQISRSSMASHGPDGPAFISIFPVWYHCAFMGAIVLFLVLFVVKKPLGGILQAVLKSVVPTYPERKRSSLDLTLENTVCWIVVILSMMATGMLFPVLLFPTGPKQWAVVIETAILGFAGPTFVSDNIPHIPGAIRTGALLLRINLLLHLIKTCLCFPSFGKITKRPLASIPLSVVFINTRRVLSGAAFLPCMIIAWLCLDNAGLTCILFATSGHIVNRNGSHTNPNQFDLHPLGSIIIWGLVIWLVSCSCFSSQSHKEPCKSQAMPTMYPVPLWRLMGQVGLVAGVLCLLYLPSYPASPPSTGVCNILVGRFLAEKIVNRPEWHPVEYIPWLGTRVLREPAVLDSEPYLNTDHRCTLQLRGGMPGRRFPTEDSGSPKIPAHGSANNGNRHPMRTRSFISTCMNSTTVQRGTPVSAAVSRLIYTFGGVVGDDREDIKVSIEQLNSHPEIQRKCEQLEHAGFKYLQIFLSARERDCHQD